MSDRSDAELVSFYLDNLEKAKEVGLTISIGKHDKYIPYDTPEIDGIPRRKTYEADCFIIEDDGEELHRSASNMSIYNFLSMYRKAFDSIKQLKEKG